MNSLSLRQSALRLAIMVGLSVCVHVMALRAADPFGDVSRAPSVGELNDPISSSQHGDMLFARLSDAPSPPTADPAVPSLQPAAGPAVAAPPPPARENLNAPALSDALPGATKFARETNDAPIDADPTTPFAHYLRQKDVDQRAHPLNPPDMSVFNNQDRYVGQHVRLRIYVDRDGHVAHQDVLPETLAEAEVLTKMLDVVGATTFFPAEKAGQTVDSYLVVDLSVVPFDPTSIRYLPALKNEKSNETK